MIPSMLLGGLGRNALAGGGGLPAAPNPTFANVKSLLHFEGADASTTFTDVIGKTWSVFGNAQIDTAFFKYGSASGLFDGTGDYINTASDADFDIFAGDFCVEVQSRFTSAGATDCIWWIGTSSTNYCGLFVDSSVFKLWTSTSGGGGAFRIVGSSVATSTFHHVAVTKSGTTFTLWVNGASAGTSTTSVYPTGNAACWIARSGSGTTQDYAGSIDEFRVVKGEPLYTTAFTPPAAQFPDS